MYVICSGGNVGIKSSCLPRCDSMDTVELVYCYQYKTLHYYKTLKKHKWHWLSNCSVKQILRGLCAIDDFRSSHMGTEIVKVLPNVNRECFSRKHTTLKMTSILVFFQRFMFIIRHKINEILYSRPQKKGAEQLVGSDRKSCSQNRTALMYTYKPTRLYLWLCLLSDR